ncbi:hypothetical protein JK361_37310 [Streptomyces sp. 5-8]|uniref:Uncharacterized protein n=1 Tax=Streptomyces musisoli TaxID=2802280 RepID=A0ABS1PDP5_9ACTN|nr:hypothetical protein [Streptomyces musisoli]MBL1110155.1 hypothetical protein [Streptomyces musisoli]
MRNWRGTDQVKTRPTDHFGLETGTVLSVLGEGEALPTRAGWSRPRPIGDPQAAEQAYFVAAPLLAGAAVATVGVLGADGAQFRWPGPAMLCLTLAAIALIGSIQTAFRARSYLYSPAELRDWWEGEQAPSDEVLQQEQRWDFAQWRLWVNRAALVYNLGIVLLGCGVAGLLAPPAGASEAHAGVRWLAAGATVLGTGWELIFMARQLMARRRRRRLVRGE